MRWLIAFGLLLVVLGLHGLSFITGVAGLSRILSETGAPAWAPWAGSLFLEVAKAILLVAAAVLFMSPGVRSRALGLVCGAIWLAAAALSIAATKGTVSDLFAAKERTATLSTERRDFLRDELQDAEAQLARVQASRPVEVVRAEVERLKLSPRWSSSEGCTTVTTPESRTVCDQYQRAFAEIAAATKAAQVRSRIADLRRQLGETPTIASTEPMIAAFDLLVGRWVGISGLDGIALLVVVMVELGSMFGVAAIGLLIPHRIELQSQPHPLDRVADRQVAALTEAVGTMRAGDIVSDPEPVPGTFPTPDNDAHPHILVVAPPGQAKGQSRAAARDNQKLAPGAHEQRQAEIVPEASEDRPQPARARVSLVGSNVAAFAQECLVLDAAATVAASDVRSTYEAWSRARGEEPLNIRTFGMQLNAVVSKKWKTGGIIKYRGVRLSQRTAMVA